MLDLYLRRLRVRAKADARNEIDRLIGNLAAANGAIAVVERLSSEFPDGDAGDNLRSLHSDLMWLRKGSGSGAIAARRQVCKTIPQRRRQRVILSAMAAISTSRRGGDNGSEWDDGALEHGIVVSEASIIDPGLFKDVIVWLQALTASKVTSGTSLGRAVEPAPYFSGPVPRYPGLPRDWCSFVADLHPENLDCKLELQSRRAAGTWLRQTGLLAHIGPAAHALEAVPRASVGRQRRGNAAEAA